MRKITLLLATAAFLVYGCGNQSAEYIQQLEKTIKDDSVKKVAEMEMLKSEMQERIDSLQDACGNCNGNFHVITGSFREQANADNYLAEMSKLGYKAEIVEAPNGFHLVSTYCGQTLNEMFTALNTARNNVNPESWIYVKN
jgi:DNA mismatch repair ATPase MutS